MSTPTQDPVIAPTSENGSDTTHNSGVHGHKNTEPADEKVDSNPSIQPENLEDNIDQVKFNASPSSGSLAEVDDLMTTRQTNSLEKHQQSQDYEIENDDLLAKKDVEKQQQPHSQPETNDFDFDKILDDHNEFLSDLIQSSTNATSGLTPSLTESLAASVDICGGNAGKPSTPSEDPDSLLVETDSVLEELVNSPRGSNPTTTTTTATTAPNIPGIETFTWPFKDQNINNGNAESWSEAVLTKLRQNRERRRNPGSFPPSEPSPALIVAPTHNNNTLTTNTSNSLLSSLKQMTGEGKTGEQFLHKLEELRNKRKSGAAANEIHTPTSVPTKLEPTSIETTQTKTSATLAPSIKTSKATPATPTPVTPTNPPPPKKSETRSKNPTKPSKKATPKTPAATSLTSVTSIALIALLVAGATAYITLAGKTK